MKSWALTAIACLAVLQTSSSCPVMAQEYTGARSLYFEQLDRPTDSINTGIQYWIELHQGNKVTRANNKTAFHAGDKIRFHLKPNIDGYAYIVLKSGSRGEQAVLFPDQQRQQVNQVMHGQEIILPTDGTLKFDDNAGVEKLTLVVSRKPIDPSVFLEETKESAPKVAMSTLGSKDLVPNRVFVAYNDSPTSGPPASITRAATHTTTTDTTASAKPAVKEKSETTQPAVKPVIKPHKAAVKIAKAPKTASPPAAHKTDTSTVTVVYNDPSGVLAADISLEHQ